MLDLSYNRMMQSSMDNSLRQFEVLLSFVGLAFVVGVLNCISDLITGYNSTAPIFGVEMTVYLSFIPVWCMFTLAIILVEKNADTYRTISSAAGNKSQVTHQIF